MNISKMLSKWTKLDELLDSPKQVNLDWKSRLRRKFRKQGIIEALEDYNLKTDKSLLNKIGKNEGDDFIAYYYKSYNNQVHWKKFMEFGNLSINGRILIFLTLFLLMAEIIQNSDFLYLFRKEQVVRSFKFSTKRRKLTKRNLHNDKVMKFIHKIDDLTLKNSLIDFKVLMTLSPAATNRLIESLSRRRVVI